ncbi:hypothetical protein SK571_43960 [Lentzea sp. BCCO 10_0798]|uniref:Lipoprotein n=1 Tax=Lentzea kristufekii TaxID=3095430 RepID=A0ABU4U706_9PSEU|nr:hypothetical protein [Lentzea sp. BCCO 10_0798]MDX8056373.1 hypothetical protein [Lentzea sp. BCCO 10_0798]
MAVALAAVSCSAGSGDQQATTQQKHFDVTGWGKLKPGMSKKDALATGELGATAAGKTGDCEDYRYQGAPAPDPKQLAEDAEIEQKYEAAKKAADDADAAVGPAPGANAGAAAYAAHAEKLAAAAEAGAKSVELSAESTKRIAARAEAREANGGVMFAGDKIRMIVPPPGATTAKNIGMGATVEQLKAAYPNAVDKDGKGFEVPVPDQQGVVLSFHFTDGELTTFLLFNGEAKCS